MVVRRTLIRRTKLTTAQKDFLNLCFEMNQNPNTQERAKIAQQSSISEEKVKNWFQNRRAKERDDLNSIPCLSFKEMNKSEYETSRVHPTSNDLYVRR